MIHHTAACLGRSSNLVVTSQVPHLYPCAPPSWPGRPHSSQNLVRIRSWNGETVPQLYSAGAPAPAIPRAESGPVACPSGWWLGPAPLPDATTCARSGAAFVRRFTAERAP